MFKKIPFVVFFLRPFLRFFTAHSEIQAKAKIVLFSPHPLALGVLKFFTPHTELFMFSIQIFVIFYSMRIFRVGVFGLLFKNAIIGPRVAKGTANYLKKK